MAKMVFFQEAKQDLRDIRNYLIGSSSFRTTQRYADEFVALFRQLRRFPESGAPRPQLGRGIRIGIVHPYLLIYRYDPIEDAVNMFRIVDGRRRIGPALLRRKDNQH